MGFGKWIGLLVLVISLYILWEIRELLLLLFTAVVLATALNVLVKRLQRWIARPWAVLATVLLMVTLLVGFTWLIVPAFAEQFQQLAVLFPKGLNRFNQWLLEMRRQVPAQFTPYLPTLDDLSQQLQPLANFLLNRSVVFFSSSLAVLLKILLVVVLTLMLLTNPDSYRQGFIRLFPSFYRRRVDFILDECEVALRGWLAGILFNMSMISLMSGLGLWMLGLPLVLAQALLSGLLTFIPNLGPTLTVVPPMAIALLQSPYKPFLVLAMYIGIQQIETNLLTPFVMAKQVSLLPAVTLISQVFFATFFGFFGLLLALPLTVVAQVWLQEVLVKDVLDQWRSPQPMPAEGIPIPVTSGLLGNPEETLSNSTSASASASDSDSQSDLLPE